MGKLVKPTIVVVIFLVSVWGAMWLKNNVNLSEASFMILITLAAIFSILLPNLNQLKSFSITRGELILQEIKDSEVAVKELALATLELVEASTEAAIVTNDFDEERYKRAIEELKSLTAKT
ncbi:hypothetical protein DA096_08875 [Vibrio rotiferianus]|uniref:hypothetical protein n=1 Tax=Vibrio rotiferianus TaxID=190895 RepID=UPI001110CDDE|nr:hypothetical protein [Vibrio rotiferianus]TMX32032.1 hypothetical protein DA095_21520 [Vibrio rotiferianus]TMX55276.1 hypothetical protein DA093_08320 [Vibrio rotiferianus]TMX66197.1 hypothetical protein DA096_08875 [Vibrio rotiferianus]